MTYQLQSAPSPNHGAQTVPSPCRLVVLHWWGNPSGQNPWGVVGWLRSPVSQVSAHYVIWPGNVVQLLDLRARSWANGSDWANGNSVTLECDPNNVVDTMTTVVELLADLVRSGDLAPDFQLRGHRDYYSTACPGAYYDWLPSIRKRVTDALDDTTRLTANNQEEDDMPITDADIERIAKRTAQIIIEDHPIVRPDSHAATLGQHVADIAQTCVALRDGDLPVIERPDGSHRAELGLVLGNLEQRLVSIDDRIGGAK